MNDSVDGRGEGVNTRSQDTTDKKRKGMKREGEKKTDSRTDRWMEKGRERERGEEKERKKSEERNQKKGGMTGWRQSR